MWNYEFYNFKVEFSSFFVSKVFINNSVLLLILLTMLRLFKIFGQPSLSFVRKSTGEPVEQVYEKMSKSKANGVDPLVVIEEDGVDLARMQLLIAAAPRQPLNWGHSRGTGNYNG